VFAVITGMALFAVVCACAFGLAWKATAERKASRYYGLSEYGGSAQLLSDKHDLRKLGYVQLLRRNIGGIPLFGLSFNVCGLTAAAFLLFAPVLHAGGPSVIGYGLPVAALFSLLVAASLAELSSAMPAAGGVGFWAQQLGGRKWGVRAGWYGAAGHLATLALFNMGCSIVLDSLLSSKWGYTPSSFSFWLAVLAVTVSQAALHTWGAALLGVLQSLSMWLQGSLALAIVCSLVWLLWPPPYSPSILYSFYDGALSGTVSAGGFLAGCLLLLKLFIGFDAAAHVAEETVEPRVRVPWAMYLTVVYVALGGISLLSMMAITLGFADWASGEASLLRFMTETATGGAASVIAALLIVFALWGSGLQSMTVCSRALFSLSRDYALPFSSYWSAVSFRSQSPARAVWLAAGFSPLLLAGVFAAAGSSRSEDVIRLLLSCIVVFAHASYAIPIGLRLLNRIERTPHLSKSPWQLGDWSPAVNWTAFIWLLATSILASTFVHHFAAVAAAALLLATSLTGFLTKPDGLREIHE